MFNLFKKKEPKEKGEPFVHITFTKNGDKKCLYINGTNINQEGNFTIETWVRSNDLINIYNHFKNKEE